MYSYIHCGLASALLYIVFAPGPRLMEQPLWGMLSLWQRQMKHDKTRASSYSLFPTSSTKQVICPFLVSK